MKYALAIALVTALFCTFSIESSGQTIADVARRERARQQTAQSKAVFTPGTLAPSTVTPNPVEVPADVPGVEKAGEAPAPATPSGPTDTQGRDEKWWRTAFAEARTALGRAESKLTLVDLKIKQLNAELLSNSAMYNRENRIGSQTTIANAELTAAKAGVESAKQRIANLEEDLRRSRGLPGWAR
jgi:hypothetical protein